MRNEIFSGFRLVAALLAGAFSCVAVSGQAPETRLLGAEGSGGDVFQISQGKSFSASVPDARRPPVLTPATLLRDIDDALRLIYLNYVDADRLPSDGIIQTGSNGMLRVLDPHSKFFGKTNFRELLGEHQNKYAGIGVTLQTFAQEGKNEIFVLATAESSPADRAGLGFGDRVIAVDGKSAEGLDSAQVRERLRGPIGTGVRLTVERNATGVIEMIELRRENIPIRTVKDAFPVSPSAAYLDLTVGFGYSTPDEVKAAIKKLSAQGMDSLIIDLRSNRGGLVDAAVKIAEMFLPQGSAILSEKGRYPDDNLFYKSQNPDPISVPIVLLVNGETASAAEILAGALQDNDRALVIGETTYGKGLVQEVIGFEDGSGMALTAARYYTPSGRSIQREYSDAHLYDYFRNAGRGISIESSASASRTLTNRVVYGGSGIAPDIPIHLSRNNRIATQKLNTAFAIARRLTAQIGSDSESRQIAQCEAKPSNGSAEALFALSNRLRPMILGQSELQGLKAEEQREIVGQAQQFLLYALCGRTSVGRFQMFLDPLVLEAINAVPRAAALAQEAERVRRKNK